MWCPSPHKVEILMLIQSRDKDLVSCATLRTTFALQATDHSVLLHLMHESIFVPICCRTYFTTLLSLPVLVPFGMVFVGWLCWKNSTGQRGHNILFEFAHTHLGLGSQNIILGSWRPRLPSWGPNCWNHPRYLTLPVSLENGWNRRVYLVYHNMFFDVL